MVSGSWAGPGGHQGRNRLIASQVLSIESDPIASLKVSFGHFSDAPPSRERLFTTQ